MSRPMPVLLLAIAALIALALGVRPAAAAARPTPTPAPTARATPAATPTRVPATAAAGLETYKRLGCVGCHKLTAAGSHGGLGPSHDKMGTVAAQRIAAPDYSGSATTAAQYIAESIVHPEVYIVPEYVGMRYRMPQYPNIRSDEVAALVALLSQQK